MLILILQIFSKAYCYKSYANLTSMFVKCLYYHVNKNIKNINLLILKYGLYNVNHV